MVRALVEKFDGGSARGGRINRIAFLHEILSERVSHHRLVVYNKNSHFFVLHLFLLSRNRRTLGHHIRLSLLMRKTKRIQTRKAEARQQTCDPRVLLSLRGSR